MRVGHAGSAGSPCRELRRSSRRHTVRIDTAQLPGVWWQRRRRRRPRARGGTPAREERRWPAWDGSLRGSNNQRRRWQQKPAQHGSSPRSGAWCVSRKRRQLGLDLGDGGGSREVGASESQSHPPLPAAPLHDQLRRQQQEYTGRISVVTTVAACCTAAAAGAARSPPTGSHQRRTG